MGLLFDGLNLRYTQKKRQLFTGAAVLFYRANILI